MPTLLERCSLKKLLILSCLLVAASSSALADNFIYANNASFGSPYVFQIDKTTGAVTNSYTNLQGNNGRGSVVVGTTLYYTDAGDNHVYAYNLATKTQIGSVFTVTGSSALSTIAYDGTNFWIGDYSGTNHAYLYTPTGTLLKTVSLSKCTGFCDGLEYFVMNNTGYLISNESDEGTGSYDLYDTNGNLVTANYLNESGHNTTGTTGIAFDGTNFYTSNINDHTFNVWAEDGTFIKTLTLTGNGNLGFLIEDLSADYSQVLPPPPPSDVPEPSTFVLVGSSMLGLAGAVRRRFARNAK
jgi:hypothetical protein